MTNIEMPLKTDYINIPESTPDSLPSSTPDSNTPSSNIPESEQNIDSPQVKIDSATPLNDNQNTPNNTPDSSAETPLNPIISSEEQKENVEEDAYDKQKKKESFIQEKAKKISLVLCILFIVIDISGAITGAVLLYMMIFFFYFGPLAVVVAIIILPTMDIRSHGIKSDQISCYCITLIVSLLCQGALVGLCFVDYDDEIKLKFKLIPISIFASGALVSIAYHSINIHYMRNLRKLEQLMNRNY